MTTATVTRPAARPKRGSRRAAPVAARPAMVESAWLRRLTPGRIVYGAILALALAMPLMNWERTYESFELPKQVSLHIGLHVTLALALAATALRLLVMPVSAARETLSAGLGRATRWPPLLAAGLVLAAWTISTLASVAPTVSFWGTWPRWAGWWQQLHVVILFVLAAAVLTSLRRMYWLVVVVSAGAAVSAAFALFQRFVLGISRPHSTFGNPNFLSDYIALALPLTIAAGVAARSGNMRVFWVISALLQCGAVVVTETRGVWVALAMGLPLLVILLVRHRGGPWLRVALALGAAGLLVIAGLYTFRGPLKTVPGFARVVSIFEARDESSASRLVVWGTARQLWQDRPVVGFGPDSFGSVSGRRLPPQNEAILSESTQELFDRAHNTTLDGLVAVGVVGMLALGSVALLVVWCGYRLLRVTDLPQNVQNSERPDQAAAVALARSPLLTGMVAGLAAYIVAQQFSIESAGASSLAWTLAGAMAGAGLHLSGRSGLGAGPGAPETKAASSPVLRAAPPAWALGSAGALVLLVLAGSFAWEWRQIQGSIEFKRGNSLARAQRGAEASAAYEESIKHWPFERRTWLELAFARRQNALSLSDAATRDRWLREAKAAGDRSLAIDPQNPLYLSKWADVVTDVGLRVGDASIVEQAITAHERAISIAPDRWVLWADAGYTYLRTNQLEKAREALTRTLTLYQKDWIQHARYGDLLAATGDKSGARRSYQQALTILTSQKQDNQAVRDALARLGPE